MSDAERAAEVAERQLRIGELLQQAGAEAALLLDGANFAWLTAGAHPCLAADPAEPPALFVVEKQRWVLCANVDTQRLFDEELDDLGFQVKEWPWQLGRRLLLQGLINGRKIVCDQALDGCIPGADAMRQLRLARSAWDQARLRELGRTMAHALEATCRNCVRGDTEQEIAGQLSHRLIHRGVTPAAMHVSADGRLRRYPRSVPGKSKTEYCCVIQATGRRHGLHVTACRTLCFGTADEPLRQEYDHASRLSAVLVSESLAGRTLAAAIAKGQQLLQPHALEHEWRRAPIGWVTGPAAVELPFTPISSESLQPGWAIVWSAAVGAGLVADTFLVSESGLECTTAAEAWPLKRFKIGDQFIDRPDILIRE